MRGGLMTEQKSDNLFGIEINLSKMQGNVNAFLQIGISPSHEQFEVLRRL
jgi:hypothetical protein